MKKVSASGSTDKRVAALRISSSKKAFNYSYMLPIDKAFISPAMLLAGCSQTLSPLLSALHRRRIHPFSQSLVGMVIHSCFVANLQSGLLSRCHLLFKFR